MGRHGDAANTLSTGAPFLLRLERLDLLIWSVNAKRSSLGKPFVNSVIRINQCHGFLVHV